MSVSLTIERNEKTLNIVLPSILDRNNADDVLSAINEKLDDGIDSIVFKADDLKYISADGLDVILELKKKYENILIDNARIGIYDTLALYGFDHFVDINKKYRFVSVEGCKVIGEGGHGTIYKIGEDTILKVYKDHSPIEVIENERQYAKNAFVNGVPTAIAYDVVETNQGYGVIFEMINGMTLGQYLEKHPEKLEEYSVKFADLLHVLHTTNADPTLYDDFQDVIVERCEAAKKYISDDEGETLKRIVKSIPKGNGMIHGDYHPNNVMIDDEGELILIDMADISRGNGFFDLGGSYLVMNFMVRIPFLRLAVPAITALSAKANLKMWDILMHRYFDTDDGELIKKYNEKYKAFSNIRIATSMGMNTSHAMILRKIMALYTRKIVIPKADKYIKLFSETN